MKAPVPAKIPRQRARRPDLTPNDAIHLARKQAESGKNAVIRASAATLAAILSLPKREWWKSLHNIDLTPGDRSTLEQQLELSQNAKPESPWSASGPGALKRFWGRSRHRIPSVVTRIFIAAVIGVPTFAAILNTSRTVTVEVPEELLFRFPDGSRSLVTYSAGDRLIVVHALPMGMVARRWVDRVGYGYATY